MMLIPSRRLLGLLLGWTLLGLAASIWPKLESLWRILGQGLAGLALVDAALLLLPKGLSATRDLPSSLALGEWVDVKLTLHCATPFSWRVTVMDHAPAAFEAKAQGQTHRVPGRGFLELHYRLRPSRRGRFDFGPVQIRISGLLGLMVRDLRLPCPTEVKVFPDFAAVARYALLATDNRLSALGILKRPRRGEGMDFHQLREFRTGDSLRRIDWKATARSRKLISRDYQDERDQQVVFLLDCGRRMRALDAIDGDAIGHFDQALNAMFLLSFVALKQGDAVGVATCAEDHPRLLAPRKGLVALQHLFHQLFDVQPSTHATDYLQAAESLRSRLRKRSLIVLLTNLRDEEDASFAPALALLRAKHLVLVANLREAAVDQILASPTKGFVEARLQASTLAWMEARERTLRRLEHAGVQVLDVPPESLPAALVNRYLEMKTGGVF